MRLPGQNYHGHQNRASPGPVRRVRNHMGKKEMLLSRGGCGFRGSFRGVDDDGLLAAFGSGGVDGIQVDAFRGELVEALRERAGLVGQIVLLRGSFRVGDAGCVEGFLGAPGIVNDELNCAGRSLSGAQKRENVHLGIAKGFGDFCDCTGLIVNRDGELFGFGHVGTSCRARKDYTPPGCKEV